MRELLSQGVPGVSLKQLSFFFLFFLFNLQKILKGQFVIGPAPTGVSATAQRDVEAPLPHAALFRRLTGSE